MKIAWKAFFCSTSATPFFRPDRGSNWPLRRVAVKDGRHLGGHPTGLVLDGRERGGKLPGDGRKSMSTAAAAWASRFRFPAPLREAGSGSAKCHQRTRKRRHQTVRSCSPIRFKARIRDNGEVELDLRAFQVTKKRQFLRRIWWAERNTVPEFTLSGVAADGLVFESDSVTFNHPGERSCGTHNRVWSKPIGEVGEAHFIRALDQSAAATFLRLRLKGFECVRALYAECTLGKIHVAGETKLGDPENLTGYITIEAWESPSDAAGWRNKAEKLLEHLRRILSLASATMLQAPILEYVHCHELRVECLSQSRQNAPVMRVFHKINLQPVLDAAIASFFDPPIAAKNLFFAIEWFAMSSTYNEVRLVNAMTALENLLDSNLPEEETLIQLPRDFRKTREILRKVIKTCLNRWPPKDADVVRKDLSEKLADLNRRSLKRKLYLLAMSWQVPLEGISEEQVSQAIDARNRIVHKGQHSQVQDVPDLWDHMTVARELVVRFLLTAIGFRGQYISHVGGHRFAHFPPGESGK